MTRTIWLTSDGSFNLRIGRAAVEYESAAARSKGYRRNHCGPLGKYRSTGPINYEITGVPANCEASRVLAAARQAKLPERAVRDGGYRLNYDELLFPVPLDNPRNAARADAAMAKILGY